jgi:MFS transporter, putative metabolite:H+ symporter
MNGHMTVYHHLKGRERVSTMSSDSVQNFSSKRILIASGLGLLFDSMDVGLLSYVLVSVAKLWHLSPTVTGLIGSVSLIGMAVGSALAGSLSDRFGRRKLFMITLLIYSLATGLSALATGVGIFFVLRFLVGIGLGGELPVATTYVLESSPEEVRGRRVVFLESFWALGSLVAAILAFFVIPSVGWRVVFLIGAIPALYTVVLRYALPESKRYQQLTKRPSIGESFRSIWSNGMARRSLVTWILWFYSESLDVLLKKFVTLVHAIRKTIACATQPQAWKGEP